MKFGEKNLELNTVGRKQIRERLPGVCPSRPIGGQNSASGRGQQVKARARGRGEEGERDEVEWGRHAPSLIAM